VGKLPKRTNRYKGNFSKRVTKKKKGKKPGLRGRPWGNTRLGLGEVNDQKGKLLQKKGGVRKNPGQEIFPKGKSNSNSWGWNGNSDALGGGKTRKAKGKDGLGKFFFKEKKRGGGEGQSH